MGCYLNFTFSALTIIAKISNIVKALLLSFLCTSKGTLVRHFNIHSLLFHHLIRKLKVVDISQLNPFDGGSVKGVGLIKLASEAIRRS